MMFDLVWIMTGGCPPGATETVSTYVYKRAFDWNTFDLGYPSAIAVLESAMIIAFVILRNSGLRILGLPQLSRPRIYGAYQLDKAGAVITALMEMTRGLGPFRLGGKDISDGVSCGCQCAAAKNGLKRRAELGERLAQTPRARLGGYGPRTRAGRMGRYCYRAGGLVRLGLPTGRCAGSRAA